MDRTGEAQGPGPAGGGGAPLTALDDTDEDDGVRGGGPHGADGETAQSRARLSINTPAPTGDGAAPGPHVAASAAESDRPVEGNLPSSMRAGRAETTRPECD